MIHTIGCSNSCIRTNFHFEKSWVIFLLNVSKMKLVKMNNIERVWIQVAIIIINLKYLLNLFIV